MNVKEIKEVSSINTSTTISLILSVKINGITVEAIIDTGAHITVINEKLAKQLKRKRQILIYVYWHRLSKLGQGHRHQI
jgi:hypothetical protein